MAGILVATLLNHVLASYASPVFVTFGALGMLLAGGLYHLAV